ncbi:hypothetical protein [Streptomyces sp. NPDC053720]|uniref:hypothetical protein n=1 Tax=Streptomyces sp. NPDC053720 TaxID=3154855 RepID=UPI003420573A
MELLARFGELAWFKLISEPDPIHGYQQVPYLAWRYTSPEERTTEIFESAVTRPPMQLKWTFDPSARNWFITPSRVVRELQERGNSEFQKIMCEIKDEDHDFCVAALHDFDIMIDFLEDIPFPAEDT